MHLFWGGSMPAPRPPHKEILDHLRDGVYVVDRDLKIVYWNDAAQHLSGYVSDEMLGRFCWDNALVHIDSEGRKMCHIDCPLRDAIENGSTRENNYFILHKEGYRRPVAMRVAPWRKNSNHIDGAIAVFNNNLSAETMLEEIKQLRQMAMCDCLTGMVNRRYLETVLRSAMGEYRRYSWPFGVIFIDIDFFKTINDAFGHDVGDHALQVIAKTLEKNIRTTDVVGRWGGEEFLAIVRNVNHEQLIAMAEKMRILIARSTCSELINQLTLTVSMGVTLVESTDSVNGLLKRADALMYQAKRNGRDQVQAG